MLWVRTGKKLQVGWWVTDCGLNVAGVGPRCYWVSGLAPEADPGPGRIRAVERIRGQGPGAGSLGRPRRRSPPIFAFTSVRPPPLLRPPSHSTPRDHPPPL